MEFKIANFVRIKDHRIYNGKKCIFSTPKTRSSVEFLREAYNFLKISYPKFHKMDELSRLGILATEALLEEEDLKKDTALVFSNSASSLETDKRHNATIGETVSPAVFVYTLPNIVMGEICIKYGFQNENVFFISEKFDSQLIENYSVILLDNLVAKAVVCGWIEWKNDEYDVFLCLIKREGDMNFSAQDLEALYNFEYE